MKAFAKAILLLVFTFLALSLVPRLAQAAAKTYTLTVAKSGSGSGTVASSPTGINCGSTCSAGFKTNTSVILTATAATGSTFTGWSGACTGTASTCTVAMSSAKTVTASFVPVLVNLTLAKTGSGAGNVASSPAGIDCGASCSASFNQFSTVTLTATAAAGSSFAGWSGACSGTASPCTVTMTQAQTVSASFSLITETLSVSNSGSGTGNVASLPIGINCGTSCSADFNQFSTIMLAASAAAGSSFDGWSGACTGTASTCTVTMNQAQTVNASFSLIPQTLTVTNTGSGTGTVVSSPAGINCGSGCAAGFTANTLVTLTASPAAGSTFTGWSGACTGTTATCTLTMNQAQNVTADFALPLKTLSVANAGSGAGTVTSSPTGINCGTTCSATFTANTAVTLTAASAAGSTFRGWLGACTGLATTCTVTLSQSRSVSATFSAPAVTAYQYDPNGNLTQITDPLGRIRQRQFDTLNQLVRQLEPHPTVVGSTQGQIDIAYDQLGQVAGVTDPRHLTTSYTVDSLGNQLQQTSPDTGITDASHDAAGNLKTRTDARGKTANYSYDSLNRISQIAYDDQTVTYTWDNCANGIGRLCNVANNNSSTGYGYDSHGRLTNKTQTAGATPLTVGYAYNTAGQRIGSLSPGGQTIEYQWTGGRITAILINGQPLLTQIGYDPDGRINGWTWGNNQPHERYYDLAGRAVMVSLGTDAATQQADSRYYGYDAAGRQINAIDDTDPTLNQHHDYDELDRLTGSQRGDAGQSRIDYSYDLGGNRTGKVLDNTVYNYNTSANSNQLQSQSGAQTVSYSYDPAGNLIGDGIRSYSYNAAGQRIAVIGQAIGYGYDALGQRITKTVAGNTTQYVYDEQGRLTGEYAATGQLIQEIVWLDNLPVAVLKPTVPAGATADIYYLHADPLGTPRKITRPLDNKVVWTWESEAFGNSLPDQNPSGLGSFTFNLRFPGQYYDAETGLHYNMARDYDPKTGRYIESDPIGLGGGINTYTYVGNNPVNLIDPLGLCEEGQAWKSSGQKGECVPEAEAGYLPGNAAEDFVANCPLPQAKAVAVFGTLGKSIISKVVPKTTLQNPRNLIPTQSKAEMSGSQIKRIAKDMKQNGYNGEPVDVSVNPATGRLEIQDGHHRTAAAIKAGIDQIPVRVAE